MPAQNEFVSHVIELLGSRRAVQVRRMFGGHGLYCDGLFVGIVHDDMLYLKTDALNRAEFERAGGQPFRYSRRGRMVALNFHRVPDDALDGAHQMQSWADRALAAAVRARKPIRRNSSAVRKKQSVTHQEDIATLIKISFKNK